MTTEVDEIWFVDKIDFLKARTSTNTKPEVVLSVRGSNFEKSIGRHISVVAVDQNDMTITAMRSKLKLNNLTD